MNKHLQIFIQLLLLAIYFPLLAQSELSSTHKKAIDTYNNGIQALQARKIDDAMVLFEKAVEKDPEFAEAWLRIAQVYSIGGKTDDAAKYYQKSIALAPDLPTLAPAYETLGKYFLRKGSYIPALSHFEKYIAFHTTNILLNKWVIRQINNCRFAIAEKEKNNVIKTEALPKHINIFSSQYFPVLTADRETLVFTGLDPQNFDENLYLSNFKDHQWQSPELISPQINTSENEGTCSISANGRMLVFTACHGRKGLGSCDLFVSYKNGNDWTEPLNIGDTVNSSAWESQPSLSADGKTLYFVSDRLGGVGKKDIWVSYADSSGKWSKAKNIGKAINTPDDDISPFIHANGETLFFASEGYVGMGGLDIYFSQLKNNTWTLPENLGFPINNHLDQVALFITADGKQGYYSLEGTQTNGSHNAMLYTFELPEVLQAKFKKTHFLKGRILDNDRKIPIQADVELYNLKNNELLSKTQSDSQTGEYTTTLPEGGDYAVFVEKQGFFFKSLPFNYTMNANDKLLDIRLESLKKDSKEVLKNIYFATARWDLEEKSKPELEKLVRLLKTNPALKIEISGHTDNVGSDGENLLLSQRRAKSVLDYLVAVGIVHTQIKSEGYGKTRPAVPNNSDENRQLNRRIEVKVL